MDDRESFITEENKNEECNLFVKDAKVLKAAISYIKISHGIIKLVNDTKCLHCGENIPNYCENCYQELIGINAKLQKEKTELVNAKIGIDLSYEDDEDIQNILKCLH